MHRLQVTMSIASSNRDEAITLRIRHAVAMTFIPRRKLQGILRGSVKQKIKVPPFKERLIFCIYFIPLLLPLYNNPSNERIFQLQFALADYHHKCSIQH